jgi:hypothetical protein
VVSSVIANRLNLARYSIKDTKLQFNITIANSTRIKLKYFVRFWFGVKGVWREVKAAIRQFTHDKDYMILIGLP